MHYWQVAFQMSDAVLRQLILYTVFRANMISVNMSAYVLKLIAMLKRRFRPKKKMSCFQ